MFLEDKRQFGQWEELLKIIPDVVKGASTVASSFITSSAQKSIAKIQTKGAQQMGLLNLQRALAFQSIAHTGTQEAGLPGTELLSKQVAGIPLLYLLIGAGAFLLLRR